MARFAPVVPIQIAEDLQIGPKDYLGRYHLLLAHDVLDKPDAYKRVYSKVKADYSDAFIIMDNSIVELGKAMELDNLVEAARIVQADCIVVPDVMGDGAGTRAGAREFARQYAQFWENEPIEEPYPLMGVLQGSNVEDAMETCAVMYCQPMVEYISVPRIFTQTTGSRMPLLCELMRRDTYKLFSGIHLLGFSDNILDDISCARMPIVSGIDSAVPIRAGLANMEITDALWATNWSQELGPRGKFWETHMTQISKAKCTLIRDNIDLYRGWIKE